MWGTAYTHDSESNSDSDSDSELDFVLGPSSSSSSAPVWVEERPDLLNREDRDSDSDDEDEGAFLGGMLEAIKLLGLEHLVSSLAHAPVFEREAFLSRELRAMEVASDVAYGLRSQPKRGGSRNHEGATTTAERAARACKSFLLEGKDNILPTTSRRLRNAPERFVARPASCFARGAASTQERPPDTSGVPTRRRDTHKARTEKRARARAEYVESLAAFSSDTHLHFSWDDRRNLCVCAYARAMEKGLGKMQAALHASIAARVDERTARRYVKKWLQNEGFFAPCNWGKNAKIPRVLEDEQIRKKKQSNGCN